MKNINTKVYRVGGCIRDDLLGLKPKDIDHVVVGSNCAEMIEKGFKQVGKDFPVFLFDGDEYALARTEKKSGKGYNGFTTEIENVTLEQDLGRRDLTINAMAWSESTGIIDPYGGQEDLKAKVLRHVSLAFSDDPLRVLRVCRFVAQFGFSIHPTTMELMKSLVNSGEMETLSPDRIWLETEKAIITEYPRKYFDNLQACGALKILFPEIYNLIGKTQVAKYHPEGDAYEHTMQCLEKTDKNIFVRFGALFHDIGKGKTPTDLLPSHIGHEKNGFDVFNFICSRYPVPKKIKRFCFLVIRYHMKAKRVEEMKLKSIVIFFNQLDAYRRKERFLLFLECCKADNLNSGLLLEYYQAVILKPSHVKQLIHEARLDKLKRLVRKNAAKIEG